MTVENVSRSSFRFSTLLAVLLLVAVIAAAYFFIFPLKDKYDQGIVGLSQKQTELASAKSRLSQMQAFESSFTGSEVTQRDVMNLIPGGVNQNSIIETLSKTADQYEISLNSLSFGLTQGAELEANVVNITMNITGSHPNILKFFDAIQSSSRKFLIKTINVQTLENFLENVSLNLNAYYI
ncbi:hypothetical protein JW911_01785 [Candidatus Peregrinibacteria bacterium]|nr:hypothetical protein [Candidatus Peregrinibacteria bacterium]